MNKEVLEAKVKDFTEKLKKVNQMVAEYEALSFKLQGAIEALNVLISEINIEENKE